MKEKEREEEMKEKAEEWTEKQKGRYMGRGHRGQSHMESRNQELTRTLLCGKLRYKKQAAETCRQERDMA